MLETQLPIRCNPTGSAKALCHPPIPLPWHREGEDMSTDKLQNLGPAQRRVQGHSPVQERLGGAQAAALQLDSFPTGILQPLALLSQQDPDPQPHHSALKERARGGCAGNFAALGRGLAALGRPGPHCTHTSKPQPGSPGRATGSQQQLPGQRGSLNPFPAVAKRLLKRPEAVGERNPL